MKRALMLMSVLSASAALIACDKDPAGGDSSQLTIAADSMSVVIGGSASLVPTVKNTSEAPQFVSRNVNVATVNTNGAVGFISGVGAGTTYVVAVLANNANARDSIRVRVYPDTCLFARPDFGGPATAADLALFAYDMNAPLNLQQTVDSTKDGLQYSTISFPSPAGGTVPGIMVEPVERPGLRPGLIIQQPFPAKAVVPYAALFAHAGAVVIAIDPPGIRRGGGTVPFFIPSVDRDDQIQLIKDLRRAVDVLAAHPNVDEGRLGYLGVSFGGIAGAQLVGVEPRFKAAILSTANGGIVTHVTGAPTFGEPLKAMTCANRNAWITAMAPLEPIRYLPHASGTALLFQIAKLDTAVLPADAQLLYDTAPTPKEVKYYDAGHNLNLEALGDRHTWLSEKLGLGQE